MTGSNVWTLEGHTHGVDSVVVTLDGRLAVSASWDKKLKVWDLHTGREIRTLTGHTGIVNDVAVTPDGRLAVSVSEDKTLKVWNLCTGQVVVTLLTDASLNCCAVSPDGRTIVAGDEMGVVHFLEWVGWNH
jgi:WD40 repeat protein